MAPLAARDANLIALLVQSTLTDAEGFWVDAITPTPRKPLVHEAATCIASLAALDAACPIVQERMPDLIEQMLAASEGSLSPSLIGAYI